MLFKRNLPLLSYLPAYKIFPEPVRRSYLRAYKAPFYVSFCTFCASLRLKRTLFTRPIRSLPTYQVGRCNPRLINIASLHILMRPIPDGPEDAGRRLHRYWYRESRCQVRTGWQKQNQCNLRNLRLKNSCLRTFCAFLLLKIHLIYAIRSTKDYVRKNNLFMQNEPKSPKVKLNVTKVTWSIRKNEPKTNPNEPKTNPILAQKTTQRTQTNPKQTQPVVSLSNLFQKPKIQWLAKFTPISAVKKFHLILVLHRRIMFNPVSNCEMEMGTNFAKEGKITARQTHKLTFFDPLETLTRLR
jgi:hypothetical protein